MRTYEQLSKEEQVKAVEIATNNLLEAICSGAIRFNDALNQDNLQARIDAAFARAEEMHSPWFAHEYIMDTCSEEIRSMAQCDAEDAVYLQPGETAITL